MDRLTKVVNDMKKLDRDMRRKKTPRKIKYSARFEKMWETIDKPRSSGRKEQAYKIYKKCIKNQN